MHESSFNKSFEPAIPDAEALYYHYKYSRKVERHIFGSDYFNRL